MLGSRAIGERAGSGVPSIYEIWEGEGYKAPIIEERYGPDRTRLILPTVGLSTDEELNQDSTKPQPSFN